MSDHSPAATPEAAAAARRLLSAAAVRDRAARLFDLALMERLEHFRVDLSRLDPTADFVQRLIRSEHPTLEVPPHSRWRNFEVGECDRWGALVGSRDCTDQREFGRAAIDLAVISVLVDAGAGTRWSYAEAATGETYSRTEGLAVASLVMFASGAFSSEPFDPLRADALAASADGDTRALGSAAHYGMTLGRRDLGFVCYTAGSGWAAGPRLEEYRRRNEPETMGILVPFLPWERAARRGA